jgi:hypothetical protein
MGLPEQSMDAHPMRWLTLSLIIVGWYAIHIHHVIAKVTLFGRQIDSASWGCTR